MTLKAQGPEDDVVLSTFPSTVYRVARAEVSTTSPGGWWPCGLCDRDYPIHDGWLVDYYHEPTRQPARVYVCARCAGDALTMLS